VDELAARWPERLMSASSRKSQDVLSGPRGVAEFPGADRRFLRATTINRLSIMEAE